MSYLAKFFVLMAVALCHHVSAQQKEIGSSCTVLQGCFDIENAVCKEDACACEDGYVASADSKRCLRAVKHKEECESTLQCNYSDKAECRLRRCVCQIGFNYNGARCVGNLGLGSECQGVDSECVARNDLEQTTVWCYNGQCSCRDGFRRDDDRCVIGGDCDNDKLTCSGLPNSFCNTKLRDRHKCQCNDNYAAAANQTKCLEVAKELGGGCEDDLQCSTKLGRAVCSDNQCACVDGVKANDDRTRCGAAVTNVVSFACLALIGILKYL